MRRRGLTAPTLLLLVSGLMLHAAAGATALPRNRRASSATGSVPAAADGSYPQRDYLVYAPANLPPSGQRALVVFLHGCTQTAADAAAGVGWNQLADTRGFVVVYPEQRVPPAGTADTDGNAARCWNSGQAVLPRGQGELESVAQITRSVATTYGADPKRVYIVGISAGALMANVMAATYPDVYAAVGSVEGCAYLCSDPSGDQAYRRMGGLARVMPAFIVQGTADYLTNPAMGEMTVTQWLGTDDLADDGLHNATISPVPASIENRDVDSLSHPDPAAGDPCAHDFPRNPCPLGAAGIAPYPTTIREYTDRSGRVVVDAWLVHGLSHNYPGGGFAGSFTDPYGPDITTAAFDFFEGSSSSATAAHKARAKTAKT